MQVNSNIHRIVERTERIMQSEKDQRRKDMYKRILQQTIDKMEARKNGGDIA